MHRAAPQLMDVAHRVAAIVHLQVDALVPVAQIQLAVNDLDESVRFYSRVFGAQPTVLKPDYAKWMVDDPRINFAISARGGRGTGVNHLGLQVDSDEELKGILGESFANTYAAIKRAEFETFMEVISPWEREYLLLNV